MTTKPDPIQLMKFVHDLYELCLSDFWTGVPRGMRWLDAVLPPLVEELEFPDEQPQQTTKQAAE
jgi:hypothetical protein